MRPGEQINTCFMRNRFVIAGGVAWLACSSCSTHRFPLNTTSWSLDSSWFGSDFLEGLGCSIRHRMSTYFMAEYLQTLEESEIEALRSSGPLRVDQFDCDEMIPNKRSCGVELIALSDIDDDEFYTRISPMRDCLCDLISEQSIDFPLRNTCDSIEYEAAFRKADGTTMRVELVSTECDEYEDYAGEVCVSVAAIYPR